MATTYVYKRDATRLFIAMRDNGKRYKIYLPKESKPIINGEEKDIFFIEHKNNHSSFSMNDKHYQCEITLRDQNRIMVKVNGVEYKFSLESIFSYLRQNMLNKGVEIAAENNIKSQMPGKIVDVFMSEGDLVNEGEPILSLEAMKMQNEINATCNGVIRKIHVHPGQSVMQDELLVEIASIDE
ncbi:MAG: acetyl-CoA carboxylase biotin carboxyl carrier protein subunit [Porphyromonadaceae bacterium]|jgi:biotin carboxyl carrier protein|nr:acetyl-CoA carboxylase biotin carboxyl carrier protein subunit [Porphyromonadaceae bacterium]